MPSPEQAANPGAESAANADAGTRPRIVDDVLIVPADCPEEYRWWAGGRSLDEILVELKASRTVWESYSPAPYPENLRKENYPLLED